MLSKILLERARLNSWNHLSTGFNSVLVEVAEAMHLASLWWRGHLFVAILERAFLPVGVVVAPVAFLDLLVGFVLLGVATVRARVLPRWCGMLLIFSEPVAAAYGVWIVLSMPLPGAILAFAFPQAVAFRGPGAVWWGLVSVMLGYVLWLRRGAPIEVPGDELPRGPLFSAI